MAASDIIKRKVASLGMGMVEPQQGMAALERLLATPANSTLTHMLLTEVVPVVPFNWERLFSRPLQVQFKASKGCNCHVPMLRC
jgi:hypothetical protein